MTARPCGSCGVVPFPFWGSLWEWVRYLFRPPLFFNLIQCQWHWIISPPQFSTLTIPPLPPLPSLNFPHHSLARPVNSLKNHPPLPRVLRIFCCCCANYQPHSDPQCASLALLVSRSNQLPLLPCHRARTQKKTKVDLPPIGRKHTTHHKHTP